MRLKVDESPTSRSPPQTMTISLNLPCFSKLNDETKFKLAPQIKYEMLLASFPYSRSTASSSPRLSACGSFYVLQNGTVAYCTLILKVTKDDTTSVFGRELKLVLISLLTPGQSATPDLHGVPRAQRESVLNRVCCAVPFSQVLVEN